jgi:hypothetical protein
VHSLWHTFPFPGLRIKTCLSHSFGIIINYYSQGLKPLILSPLSNLSSPFPLPTLWKLSPRSLFLRGRSACNDVYILLMFYIITYTKIGSWPLTLRLSDPTTHNPTSLSILGSLAYKICLQFINTTEAHPWGYYNPLPLFLHCSQCKSLHNINKISKIFKIMGLFCPPSILMLPCRVLRNVPRPMDLYNPYA